MTDITERQRSILAHSLGLDRAKKPYRNRFCTEEGSKDFDDCQALVERGFMQKSKPVDWIPDAIFIVTEKGRLAVINSTAEPKS